jgi:FAD/FMN-containing dehydrogenase
MLSRRDVLRGLGGGLAAGLLPWRAWATPPGCGGVTLAGSGFEGLRSRLAGDLLVRGASGFEDARLLYNQRFDARPLIVVRPRNDSDVAAALRYAIDEGMPWTVKSGGHSYIGASATPGLLLDLSSLGAVEPSSGGLYRIGPGAPLRRVYARLACDGLSVPAGTCDTVGFGGLALGGGVGYLMRQHGLTIDRIRSMRVVLGDGRVVTASEQSEPDLFWALRGGGGGNFGIVTHFDVDPVPRVTLQSLSWRWPWEAAEVAMARWQQVLVDGSLPRHAVTYASFVSGPGDAPPRLEAGVISSGGFVAAQAAADLFVGPAGVAPAGSIAWWQLEGPGCSATEVRSASRYKSKSAMLYAPMAADGVRAIREAMEAHGRDAGIPSDNQASISFLSFGGAVADVAPGATAFVHRQALADVQYLAFWPQSDVATADANLAWMRTTYASTFPAISAGGAGCYVNYCDDELPTDAWPRLYYGDNLSRLQAIKRAYDPDDVFKGPQSIRDGS